MSRVDTPQWLSLADLAGGGACAPLLDGDGRIVAPLLVVDLDTPAGAGADAGLLRDARDAAAGSERILVGFGGTRAPDELLGALHMTLSDVPSPACVPVADPAARVRELVTAASANPQAALVLAQVLRAGAGLDVPAALDLESFAYSMLLGGTEFARWLDGRGARPAPPPAPAPPVLVQRAGDGLRITLNRPERRNAYGRELRDAFVDALLVAAAERGPVVVAGAGPAFCAGGDLAEFGTTPDLATAHFVRTRGGAGQLLHRLAQRTEVRLHGACVGAGIELAAFAGRVLAAPDTTIRLPEVGMGLIPGAGGTVSIPRRIGRWRTLYLALSGASLDVATAARWGLVDAVLARGGSGWE